MEVTESADAAAIVCEQSCWGSQGHAHCFDSCPSTCSTADGGVLLLSSIFLCPIQEVTDKSERITQLEQEKSALIKQLFEARARNNHETSQLDSTFI